jgi:hypothetical protein
LAFFGLLPLLDKAAAKKFPKQFDQFKYRQNTRSGFKNPFRSHFAIFCIKALSEVERKI